MSALLNRAGIKWDETGEFDLASSNIPKVGDNPALFGAIIKQGRKPGILPEVVPDDGGGMTVAELVSFRQAADNQPDIEGMERMVASRKSNDLIETWSKEIEAKASIQRNPRIIRQ